MAKDPAFLFYTGDFSTGTQFFTDEQVGKYVRLLMAQHQLGHLEEKHMIQICKTYDKDIFSKFVKDSSGKFYNERLENEVNKRAEYSKSRAENRTSKKNISFSYDDHMENENENTNTNTNTGVTKTKKHEKAGTKFSGNFKARGEEVLAKRIAENLAAANGRREEDSKSET